MALPSYFKPILWFADFNQVSLEKDWEMVLLQALEKGRMEHLRYLAGRLGPQTIWKFAQKNSRRFSRKSIVPFARVMFSTKSR